MNVRCRMAPSPTGRLHIGTAHTALFNYLFARHHGGKFILRIDDSDPARSKPEFEQDIVDNLKWLGITWDEGPDVGGPYGPYRQSQRQTSYQKYLDQLISTDHAYRCFCSKSELDQKRQLAKDLNQMYKYDQKCLHLSKSEITENINKQMPFVVRLVNPNKVVEFEDMVRGKISVDTTEAGDFILTRPDGSALLNFAVTIDDIEMGITHAIRGEDFLNATPYQILIYEALGIDAPQFANLSFIYAPDHSKLSKRHGATGVYEYGELGYLPEALVNFLILLGWNPGDDREVFSFDELIKIFDFDKVGKNMPTFNQSKLDWFNGYYIRQKTDTELAQLVKPFVKDERLKSNLTQIVPLIKDRLVKLSDINDLAAFVLTAPGYTDEIWPDISSSLKHLNFALGFYSQLATWDKGSIENGITDQIKASGWKVGDFFMSLRIALCGSRATPPTTDVLCLLGKVESLSRIQTAIKYLSDHV